MRCWIVPTTCGANAGIVPRAKERLQNDILECADFQMARAAESLGLLLGPKGGGE